MFNYRRNRWFVLSPLVLLSAVGVLGAAKPSRPQKVCQVADAWVASNVNKLPASYSEISRFPMAYRRRIWPHLSVAVRRGIWREKLQRYEAVADRFTPEQRELLALVMSRLDSVIVDRPPGVRVAALDSMWHRVRVAFGPQFVPMFATIGSSEEPSPDLLPEGVRVQQAGLFGSFGLALETRAAKLLGDVAKASAADANGDCWCYDEASEDDCGGWPLFCAPAANPDDDCTPLPSGCGPSNQDPCDAFCQA